MLVWWVIALRSTWAWRNIVQMAITQLSKQSIMTGFVLVHVSVQCLPHLLRNLCDMLCKCVQQFSRCFFLKLYDRIVQKHIHVKHTKERRHFLLAFLCFSSFRSAFYFHGNKAQLWGETMEIPPFLWEMLLFRHELIQSVPVCLIQVHLSLRHVAAASIQSRLSIDVSRAP